MRKILLFLLLTLSGVPGVFAAGSPLEEAYAKICKIPIGREVPKEQIFMLLAQSESKIHIKDGNVRISGPNLPMQQLKEDFSAVQEITNKIPQDMLRICAFNDFNNFSFYISDKSDNGLREILIVWMSTTNGVMTVWNCITTDEMIELIQAGELTMNYCGTRFSPMPDFLLNLIKNCGNQ